MSELARLEARIRGLGQLAEVVRAMRGMASSRLREAEEAVHAVRNFSHTVEEAFRAALRVDDAWELWRARARRSPARVLLLVTAEHGFVGAFSEHLAREASASLESGERLCIVGQRGAAIATEHGLAAEAVFAQASHGPGIVREAREVVACIGVVAGLRLLYPTPVRGGFVPRLETVLPPTALDARAAAAMRDPLVQLPPPALIEALAEELVFAAIVRAMLSAFAAENDARLRAMERADRNIRERLEVLTREHHRLRQETITEELLDLVAGAEAVRQTRD